MRSDEGREKPGTVKGVMKKCKATISSQMYADKSQERCTQMRMPVDSIVIRRQRCPQSSAARSPLTAPVAKHPVRKVLGLTVCAVLSHRRSKIIHQRSSRLLSALICDEKQCLAERT
jgi:hypothetical protein